MKRFLAMLVLLTMLASPAALAEAAYTFDAPPIESAAPDAELDADEALEGFINRAFGITDSGKPFTIRRAMSRGSLLTGVEAKIYAQLADLVARVASGSRSSTRFTLSITGLIGKLSYTAEELGVGSLMVYDEAEQQWGFNPAAVAAIRAKLSPDMGLVMEALAQDCPYELYWYDKTAGFSYGVADGYGSDGETMYFNSDEFTVSMYVSQDYAVTGAARTTNCDTSIAGTILAAAKNARGIVSANGSLSDFDKLAAYKDAICQLVSYNDEAANTDGYPFGNPWQLIWVFDKDPATKVVCEGYAKAFKYLCDQSSFSDSINTALISGTMVGGTGAGPHMWNSVGIDGAYYLVDVTNCDEGSVGYPDELFMKGCHSVETTRSIEDDETVINYTYTYLAGNREILYRCSSSRLLKDVLVFKNEDYEPADPAERDEDLVLPSGLTRIESQAFAGIPSGCTVFIPRSVAYIAPDAFDSTVQLVLEDASLISLIQNLNLPYTLAH